MFRCRWLRTREQLEEREAQFQTLIETAFEGAAIIQDDVVVEVNHRILDACGYTREEVLGKSVLDFVAPRDRAMIRARLAAGVDGRVEAAGIAKDGRELAFEVVSKLHHVHARSIRVVALHDVTRKRREEEQLRHAQRLESLGRLAAGVAHDFNNILQVIRTNCEFLLLDAGASQPAEVAEIMSAAEAGMALNRQLLAFARREAIQPRVVDLNTIITAAEPMLRRLIGDGVELIIETSREAANVLVDANQLQQVLFNLAVNARDAMAEGGSLSYSTRVVKLTDKQQPRGAADHPGRYVTIAVSDSGSGISDEAKAHIFEPFFSTKGDSGTGLGLATVHSIVSQSGGFIELDSVMGRGSTFTIYLPEAVQER